MSLDALNRPAHPAEELLEEYSFGRIGEPELAALEEHLLSCDVCQSRLLDIDEYTALMKAGLAGFEEKRRVSFGRSSRFALAGLPGIKTLPAAAILVVLAGAIVAWRVLAPPAVPSAAATVTLMALRGGEGDGAAHAPAGRPLDLAIDRMDLPDSLSYRVEVVSSSGGPLWSGAARIEGRNVSVRVPARLRSGAYWVRLYAGGRLLREFGLHIE